MPTSEAPVPQAQPAPSTPAPATTTPPAGSSTPPPAAPAKSAPSAAGLTVFDGSSKVLIDGVAVDFGTPVHDLAWSPDGKLAAFIDGGGNLDVAGPDGKGRVEVAKNPGKEKWSHPTWQVAAADPAAKTAAKDLIIFSIDNQGLKTLVGVSATAHDGTPTQLPLAAVKGGGTPPGAGNLWPSAAGQHGLAVYEHDQGTATQVYVREDDARQQGNKLYDGSQPALYCEPGSSAYSVVFLQLVKGHKHVIREDPGAANAKAVDLTPGLTVDAASPAWSPDGKTVAFSTPSGVEVVAADGTGQISQATTTPGMPAYRPAPGGAQ